MHYHLTGTSLVLFALLFQLSGGQDFTPSLKVSSVQPATVTELGSDYAQYYAHFHQPRIIPAPSSVQPARVAQVTQSNILQASFSTETPAGPVDPESTEDIRAVTGNRVNVRTGPSTAFEIVDTLTLGTEVALLQTTDDDWARIRLLATGNTVWVASWLLSD